MSLDYRIIGKRIRELRRKKELSLEKLAEMCNISVSHMSRIESGKKHPSLKCLVILGEVLGVTVNTFLYKNQKNVPLMQKSDLLEIIEDCNNYEKQVVLDLVISIKRNLRNN